MSTQRLNDRALSQEGTGIAGQLLSLPSPNHQEFIGIEELLFSGMDEAGNITEAPLSEEDTDELLFQEFPGIEELLSHPLYKDRGQLGNITAAAIRSTSTFRGVSKTARGTWAVKYAGKRVSGASSCITEEEAAHKYDAYLKEHVPSKYLKFRNFCCDCGKFCSPRCSSMMLAPGSLCVCTGGQKPNSQPKKLHCNGKRKSTASSQSLNEPALTHSGSAPKKAKTLAGKIVGVGGAQGCGNTYQQLKQLLLATAAMDPNHTFAVLVMTQKCA